MNPRAAGVIKVVVGISILVIAIVSMVALLRQATTMPPLADAEPERLAFEAALDELAKAGEIVRLEDLQTPPVDPANNAARTLRTAGAMADDQSPKAFHELDLSATPTDAEWKIIEDNVFELAPALALVDDAEKQTGVDWEVKWSDPIFATLLLDINPTRSVLKLVSAAAMSAHRHGQDDEAIHRISQMLMIAKATDQKPFFVTHVVALNMAKDACQQIEWLAPALQIGMEGGAAHPEQVQQLIKALLDDEWVQQRYREACANIRLNVICSARYLGEGRLSESEERELLSPSNVKPTHAQVYTDARLLLPYLRAPIVAADAKSWPEYQKRIEQVPPELADIYTHPLYVLMPQSGDRADGRARDGYQAIARLRIAAATLALRLYAADHDGELPLTLAALVPIYLPKVPLDPIAKDGGPIAYDPKSQSPLTSAKPDEESPTTKPTRENPAGFGD